MCGGSGHDGSYVRRCVERMEKCSGPDIQGGGRMAVRRGAVWAHLDKLLLLTLLEVVATVESAAEGVVMVHGDTVLAVVLDQAQVGLREQKCGE